HTLLDFFYLNRMVRVGGVIAIDDIHMMAIAKMVRYVTTYPCYEVLRTAGKPEITSKRKAVRTLQRIVHPVTSHLRGPVAQQLLDDGMLRSDDQLGLTGSMIFLRKVSDDTRPWNWHVPW
ncbi:MAG: hypothetical protein KC561_20320, partial [Myxococcales bacterium]|nr:hypothetical protein [Myxococcales bacterium]